VETIRWNAAKCEKGICQPTELPAKVAAKLEFATTYLTHLGLPVPTEITIATSDEPDARALADGASLGTAFTGRPAVVFGKHSGLPTWEDQDVVLHELSHLATKPFLGDSALRDPYGEAAVVEEAIADTFAALATDDPLWGEYSSGRDEPARSLREVVVFPEGRTGDTHADSLAISGALWSIAHEGRGAENDEVARSLVQAITRQRNEPFTLMTFADAMQTSFSPSLRETWKKAVEIRQIHRFADPIILAETGRPVQARVGAWVAPPGGVDGIRFRVADKSEDTVHLRFRAAESSATSLVCQGKGSPIAAQKAGPFYECTVEPNAAATVAIINQGTIPSWYDDVSLLPDQTTSAVNNSNANNALFLIVGAIVFFAFRAAVTRAARSTFGRMRGRDPASS
jgi:hypothetical protein